MEDIEIRSAREGAEGALGVGGQQGGGRNNEGGGGHCLGGGGLPLAPTMPIPLNAFETIPPKRLQEIGGTYPPRWLPSQGSGCHVVTVQTECHLQLRMSAPWETVISDCW